MNIARQTAVFATSVLLIVGAASLSRTEALASRAEEQLSSSPGLTIYNAKFALVRQKLPLDLKPGTNHVQVTDITAHLEPDSVILRPFDPGRRVQILEQNYRNDPVTQELLLSLYEGKTIEFQQTDKDGKPLGIVHRDVSFKNIMIAFEGDVKLTDFGIAKARGFLVDNEGEVVAGKADYMSPEQANFQITDKRSDLFSAGVVLAHLLLGKNIFKGPTPEESRQRMMNLPIPDFRASDERVDERLNQILQRALAREVDKRYATADELLYDLEHYIYHSGYGPTNETLGKYIRELFGQGPVVAAPKDTAPLDRTERICASGQM